MLGLDHDITSSSSCFAGRDGEISGPGFDTCLPNHLLYLPASNSRELLPRDVAGHSLMSRQDRCSNELQGMARQGY